MLREGPLLRRGSSAEVRAHDHVRRRDAHTRLPSAQGADSATDAQAIFRRPRQGPNVVSGDRRHYFPSLEVEIDSRESLLLRSDYLELEALTIGVDLEQACRS